MSNDWFIDTAAELEDLCTQLKSANIIALDTEFIRERTYRSRLCLIQIAFDDTVACIDPLTLDNIQCLMEVLYDTRILKVLHAARQDLEIFFDMRSELPQPIFDTQIAATLLGFSDQTGYATLVKSLLNIELDKSHTRTDWSQRPLDPQQLRYAADDVRYLLQLYPLVTQKLQETGRQDWLSDDFSALTDPQLYINHPEKAWQRVSGHGRLKPAQLAILQKLAAWREQQAQQQNKPRKWLLSDDVLISLARMAPGHLEQLKKIRGIPDAALAKHGESLIELIQQAKQIPEAEWPIVKQYARPQVEQEILADTLMAYLRLLSSENNISPATLATRKEIDKLAAGERELPILRGWRGHIVGEKLLDFINGHISLSAIQGKVTALKT